MMLEYEKDVEDALFGDDFNSVLWENVCSRLGSDDRNAVEARTILKLLLRAEDSDLISSLQESLYHSLFSIGKNIFLEKVVGTKVTQK